MTVFSSRSQVDYSRDEQSVFSHLDHHPSVNNQLSGLIHFENYFEFKRKETVSYYIPLKIKYLRIFLLSIFLFLPDDNI